MKKKVNGYEARSDKVIKGVLGLILLVASLMPLTVSADATQPASSTTTTTAPTPTPTPKPWLREGSEPIQQQQSTPSVSWNS